MMYFRNKSAEAIWRVARHTVPGLCALLLLLLTLGGAAALAGEGGEAGPPRTSGLLLEVQSGKTQVYLREPVPLTVTLFAGTESVRNIEYPRLKSPGFLLEGFALPRQLDLAREGREVTAYQFSASLTPTRSGSIQIGPAELNCEILSQANGSAAFFGGTEARRVTLRSAPLTVTVLPLPLPHPAGFGGAVGRFTLNRSARPTSVRAGDPVTVRTVIRGTGYFGSAPCNSVSTPGVQSYPPQAKASGGTLTCEQVLIPDSPAVQEIPAAKFVFFDPETGSYRSARSGPLALQVRAAPPPLPPSPRRLAAPVVPPPPVSPPAALWPVGAGAGLLLALGLGGRSLVRRRRSELQACSAPDPARGIGNLVQEAEAALGEYNAYALYTACFRVLQLLAGPGKDPASADLTTADLTAPELIAPSGTADPPAAPSAVCSLLHRCDAVRYGRHRPPRAQMSADLQLLRDLVNPARP